MWRWVAMLTLVASQATALSCLPPDVARSFQFASAIEEPVYILRGVLEFDESQMPHGVVNHRRDPAPVPAQFSGNGLTLEGFTARFESPITLQPTCAGPWCGSAQSGEEVIVFATVYSDGLRVSVDACGGTIFSAPTEAMADQLTACIRGEACTPQW